MMSKTDIEAEVTSAMALLDDLSPRSSDSGLSEDTCWALFGGPCPEALRKKIRPKVETYTEPEEVEEWHSAEMIPVDEKKQSVDKFLQGVDKKKSLSVVLKASQTSDDKNDKTVSENIPDQKPSFSDQTDTKEESVVLGNSKTSVSKINDENTENAVPVASNHSKLEALQKVDVVTSRKSLNKSSKVLVSKTSLATPNKESESLQQQVLFNDKKETSSSSKESNRLDKTAVLNTNSANTILEIQKAPSPSESLLVEITSPENAANPSKSELEVVSSIKSPKPESLEVIVPTESVESKSKTPSASSLEVEPPSSDRQQQTASPITINASAMTSKASIPQSPKQPSEKSFSSVVTPPSSRFSTPSSSESTSGCFCRCCVERQVRNSRGRGNFKKRNCKCNCCLSNFKIKIYEGLEDSSRPTNFLKFVSFNEDEITYHNKRIQTSVLTLPKPAGLESKKLKDCICGSGDYKQSTTSCSTKRLGAPSPRNDRNLVKSLTNILKKRSTVKEVVNQFESRNGRCCGPSKRPMRLIDPVYHPVKPQPPRNGICICCSKPKEEHRTCFKHSNMDQNHRCCTWQEH